VSKPSGQHGEIREINFSYLLLAQRLLREDRAKGMLCLGVPEQVADVLVNLSPAQVDKLASSVHLLCRFRFDDHSILSSLSEEGHSACTKPHTATVITT
jgi:flagellar transcriptional activator FlhD